MKTLSGKNMHLSIMNSSIRNKRGFSLIELMIVVAIIAIVVTLAYPSYVSIVNEGRRSEGIQLLLMMAQRQETFFSSSASGTYASSVTAATGLGVSSLSVNSLYTVTTVLNLDGTFTLTAQPNNWVDPLCGDFSLTSIGVRGVTGDYDGNNVAGDANDVASCWQ